MKPNAAIRSCPTDFVVEEIPAYSPSGSGSHLFLRLRKTSLTTLECGRRLAARLGVDPREVGFAGMKDRHAVTTQWFSVPFAESKPLDSFGAIELEGVELLELARHTNKLRTGHLAGNRFRLVLRDLDPPEALGDVVATLKETQTRGLPNAFGPQRFGRDGSNPERALAWLGGKSRGPSAPRERRLLISSIQSLLFDEVLRRRVQEGTWDKVLPGDLAKRRDSGGLFVSDGGNEDQERAAQGTISATGPLFGSRMRWPEGHPAEIERQVLQERLGDGSLLAKFGKQGQGTRRALRLIPDSVQATLASEPNSVVVEFVLPKGAYATTVLGEACVLLDKSKGRNVGGEETSSDDELVQDSQSDSE